MDECCKKSLVIGCFFSLFYVLCVALAWLAPSAYAFFANAMTHGSYAFNAPDFSAPVLLAGAVAWFVFGVVACLLWKLVCCKLCGDCCGKQKNAGGRR